MCRGPGHFPLTPAGRPLSGRGLLAASGALAPDPCLHPSAPARTPHLSLSVTSPLRLGCRVRRPTHPRAQSRGQSSADPRGGPAAVGQRWSRRGLGVVTAVSAADVTADGTVFGSVVTQSPVIHRHGDVRVTRYRLSHGQSRRIP